MVSIVSPFQYLLWHCHHQEQVAIERTMISQYSSSDLHLNSSLEFVIVHRSTILVDTSHRPWKCTLEMCNFGYVPVWYYRQLDTHWGIITDMTCIANDPPCKSWIWVEEENTIVLTLHVTKSLEIWKEHQNFILCIKSIASRDII